MALVLSPKPGRERGGGSKWGMPTAEQMPLRDQNTQDFRRYPFDEQDLSIQIFDPERTSEEQVYVADKDAVEALAFALGHHQQLAAGGVHLADMRQIQFDDRGMGKAVQQLRSEPLRIF